MQEERGEASVDDLNKAEEVRDRLQGLQQVAESYPAGHEMRVRLESMNLERVLEMVEDDIDALREDLLHPGGT